IAALFLNIYEHRYTTRSSDTLFLHYMSTLSVFLVSSYILYDKEQQQHEQQQPEHFVNQTIHDAIKIIRGLILSTVFFISLGFIAEAWPRPKTRVQITAREKENLNEYDQANLCSRLTFHFVDRIVHLGAKRALVPEDIDNTTPHSLKTRAVYGAVAAEWEKELARCATSSSSSKGRQSSKTTTATTTPSFFWTVLRAFRGPVLVSLFLRFIAFRLPFLTPVLLRQLLAFITAYHKAVMLMNNNDNSNKGFESDDEFTPRPRFRDGMLISFALFLVNTVGTVIGTMALQYSYDLGMKARGATIAMIYRKSLKLSPQARQKSTLGEITNHMAVDAEKWINGSNFMPAMFFVPMDIAISMYLLYQLFGWSSVAGLVVVAIVVPLNAKMASFLNTFQDEKLKWMDTRIRAEDAYREKIETLRENELLAHKRFATIRAVLAIVFSSVTLLMALATFAIYATIGGPGGTPGKMTAEVIFVGITLFSVLNRPLGRVTMMISQTIAVIVACRRIQHFLLLEEIDTTVVQRHIRLQANNNNVGLSLPAVEIENGTFSWEKNPESETSTEIADETQPLLSRVSSPTLFRPTLSNINLTIAEGHLMAIVGRIGQGKSSILGAIMGEMYKLQGTVKVYGDTIAYVPQQAWIINATLRDNVLLGKAFDKEKYDRIVYAAGLAPDFAMLPAGDHTEIGERGINLSGGQKQRVSLARVAYQDADVYLLDDPLSAVDAHVDRHLWNNLIGPHGLLKDKTRILVTHGIHHLEHVDQIVVLKVGTISETGQYQELLKARGAFYQLIKEYSANVPSKGRQVENEDRLEGIAQEKISSGISSNDASTIGDGDDVEIEEGDKDCKDDSKSQKVSGAGNLVSVEKMQEGKVSWEVVKTYAQACTIDDCLPPISSSYLNTFNCLMLLILGQIAQISTNLWLRYWITDSETHERDGTKGHSVAFYLTGYAFFVLLFMVLDVSGNYSCEVLCGVRASRTLFKRLLNRILQMPMSFFDTTPLGRIINRLSSDVDAIDTQLPNEMNDLLRFFALIGGTFFVIAYSTPAFLLVVPPLAYIYFLIQDHYIRCSASLKRLYSVSKSPLYQHFSETLSGIASIRSGGPRLLDQFVQQNEDRSDTIVNRLNIYTMSNRWLATRIEFLGNCTVLLATILAVANADKLDPSLSALALTYAINVVGQLVYLVRTVNEVQNLLVSVERIQEYSIKPTEAPRETNSVISLPENWPQEGRVVFKNYSARYREGLELVVKNVSFEVQPAEKVGIVGRTGAGKSSLTLALFRIIEAADSYWAIASDPSIEGKQEDEEFLNSNNDSGGSIEIDGIDISTLGLKDLRQRLAIIPQDPTLFAGTVRENLDPFQQVPDVDLWEALERAHLKDYVVSLAGGLSFEVAQNGENFSVGQRSLICLARALLRKTKVLILDEATAAVDVETDDLIQRTIRKEFKDRTILTIAHRIKTVMDSDKILVLEKGRVEEFEAPEVLLARKGLFHSLAEQAGEIVQ
ncbi:hypothetical protein BG004_002731, partial [Podila humilis]